jgi:membrane-bound serine protease (ClpP class)
MLRYFKRLQAPLIALAIALLVAPNSPAQTDTDDTITARAVRIEINGAIGPATSAHLLGGLAYAKSINASLVIIEMDTPGGLDSAMRDMIKAIIDSSIPVVSYVSPSGSRAASAGTYLLYASHIAAMAPATNLGAATPVQIGGGDTPSTPVDIPKPDTETDSEDNNADAPEPPDADRLPIAGTAMERKSVNDAVAYIRGLAKLRGRNADWAEQAVREAASLSAEDALELNVIDIVAPSLEKLLAAIDGRVVRVGETDQVLKTAELEIETFEADWRTRLLEIITDPNIAYMLMLAGIYGLMFEGYNPGAIVPGVVGAICLLLALFAFQLLPVNFAGLALIILGVMLIVGEAFMPSFGALGLGGIVAFIFGSIILLDSNVPGMQISRLLIFSIALVASSLLLALIYALMRLRRTLPVSGTDGMLNEVAEALEDFERHGTVFIHGERWNARTEVAISKGDKLHVRNIDGLTLEVTPFEPTSIS